MLEQVLAQVTPYLPFTTALLLFFAVLLELVHIAQTRRINKRIACAAKKLQEYLNSASAPVQSAPEQEKPQKTVPSGQEKGMRASLAQKKKQQEEELLDAVLQEIFD